MKAADVWNWDSPKETVRRNYGEQMSSGGRLSGIPLKALLYGRRRHFRSRDKDGGHTI